MSPKKRPSCPETLAWKINIRLMERIRLTSWSGKYPGGFCTIQTVVGLGISEPSTVSIIFNHFFFKHPSKNGELIFCPKPKGGLSDYDYSVRYCPDQDFEKGRGSKMMKNWRCFFEVFKVLVLFLFYFRSQHVCWGKPFVSAWRWQLDLRIPWS